MRAFSSATWNLLCSSARGLARSSTASSSGPRLNTETLPRAKPAAMPMPVKTEGAERRLPRPASFSTPLFFSRSTSAA